MKKSLDDLLKRKMERSLETLKDAKLLFDNGHYNGAVNRLYYAAFYAIGALLLKKDIYTKSHSGLKSKFHQEVINKGILPVSDGKTFDRLFDLRGNADYDDFTIYERENIEPFVEKTGELINSIQTLLDR